MMRSLICDLQFTDRLITFWNKVVPMGFMLNKISRTLAWTIYVYFQTLFMVKFLSRGQRKDLRVRLKLEVNVGYRDSSKGWDTCLKCLGSHIKYLLLHGHCNIFGTKNLIIKSTPLINISPGAPKYHRETQVKRSRKDYEGSPEHSSSLYNFIFFIPFESVIRSTQWLKKPLSLSWEKLVQRSNVRAQGCSASLALHVRHVF